MKAFVLQSARLAFLCVAFGAGRAKAADAVLSVLAPPSRLSPALIARFESEAACRVRVEFAASAAEFEQRLKLSPRTFDVIVSEEGVLASLTLARLLRPTDQAVEKLPLSPSPFMRPAPLARESRTFLPLLIDPLVVATASGEAPARLEDWNVFVAIDAQPSWRGRVRFPRDQRLLAALAAMALAPADAQAGESNATLLDWLRRARRQAMPRLARESLALTMSAGKVAAAPLWLSEALRLRKSIPGLEWTLPLSGTLAQRVAVGLVSDSLRDALGERFIAFLRANAKDLAEISGLVPLAEEAWKGVPIAKWKLYDASLPLPRGFAEGLSGALPQAK